MQRFTHKEPWLADSRNRSAAENLTQIAIHNKSRDPDEYAERLQGMPGLDRLNMSFLYNIFRIVGGDKINPNDSAIFDLIWSDSAISELISPKLNLTNEERDLLMNKMKINMIRYVYKVHEYGSKIKEFSREDRQKEEDADNELDNDSRYGPREELIKSEFYGEDYYF